MGWKRGILLGGIGFGLVFIAVVFGVDGWVQTEGGKHSFDRVEDIPATEVAVLLGNRTDAVQWEGELLLPASN